MQCQALFKMIDYLSETGDLPEKYEYIIDLGICNYAKLNAILKYYKCEYYVQHRTKRALRLCTSSACIFPVILHRNSLTYDSMSASFLYNLTKNLTAHLPHNLCAALPMSFLMRWLLHTKIKCCKAG